MTQLTPVEYEISDEIQAGQELVGSLAIHPITRLGARAWVWGGEIRRGHCHILSGATYTIFTDGSTHWKCDISSSHKDDAWLGYFRATNADGVVLFDQGGYNFNIADSTIVKRWDEFRGPDQQISNAFFEVSSVSFFCRC
jgi:hypothetical protein